MRHKKKINHLGRTSAHRGAMLSNMATSLIMHKRIFTTVAKAKALKKVVEPIITKSKEDTTHSRRTVFSTLQSKEAVTELFQNVSQKVGDRPGGYTRILRTGNRLGDNASMCFIELVDYNENMLKDASTKKTRRTRRSRRGATDATDVTATKTDAKTAGKGKGAEKSDVVKAEKTKAEAPAKVDVSKEPKAEDKAEDVETKATNEIEQDVKDEPKKEAE